jgi:hypothetical protein
MNNVPLMLDHFHQMWILSKNASMKRPLIRSFAPYWDQRDFCKKNFFVEAQSKGRQKLATVLNRLCLTNMVIFEREENINITKINYPLLDLSNSCLNEVRPTFTCKTKSRTHPIPPPPSIFLHLGGVLKVLPCLTLVFPHYDITFKDLVTNISNRFYRLVHAKYSTDRL